ncbi:cleavage polyadenylation factor subunit fip1 [Pseudocyphellaria aurata]|nr:cleavage polyadenylation factor subunit fip1 [Pseudocyphellaria aurata]
MEEEEEDDDIYAPDDVIETPGQVAPVSGKIEKKGDDLEEGEEGEEVEEDDSSDSDIDIITDWKEDPKVEHSQQRVNPIKKSPGETSTQDLTVKHQRLPVVKNETTPAKPAPSRPSALYPAIKTSTIDVDARPIYEPNDKPITEIDLDADFSEDDKPWRRPGTDMTDYFNYGFDEFTWASYCLKQDSLRKEVSDSKKQMEDMQSFLNMPGAITALPGMPGQPAAAQPSMGAIGDIPPEMQQMMAQMMAQGVDLSQMDPTIFMQQMMQGGQAGANGAQAQNFGNQNFGQQGQNQQQMGFGYGSTSGGAGGGGAGGGAAGGGGRNQGGRGPNRRNW